MKDMRSVYDANSLIDAFNKSKKGTAWKESVQRYEANLLRNVNKTQKELKDGTYEQMGFYEFDLNERGHVRHIKSMHISDRVVQRSVCDNVLVPELSKYLIYDNGASMEGKGIHFARKRLSTHLHKFYRKNKRSMKYYGRYMDDIYIIHEDKEYLKGLLNDIHGICDELGLFINPKKTQIVKLSHGFTFLKIKYTLTETGKVIERISKDSVLRERRKLKKLRKFLDEGKVSFEDVRNSYASWRGGVSHYDSYTILQNMDKLFDELFIHPFIEGGKSNEQK